MSIEGELRRARRQPPRLCPWIRDLGAYLKGQGGGPSGCAIVGLGPHPNSVFLVRLEHGHGPLTDRVDHQGPWQFAKAGLFMDDGAKVTGLA